MHLSDLSTRYVRTDDAALFLGLSRRTLEKHRTYGTGPIYRKLGGRVVYALEDLKAWADLGTRDHQHRIQTAEQSAPQPGEQTRIAARPRATPIEFPGALNAKAPKPSGGCVPPAIVQQPVAQFIKSTVGDAVYGPAYLTCEEVVERYRNKVSDGTLRNWRCKRVGPSYIKIGKAILYPTDELDRWDRSNLTACRRISFASAAKDHSEAEID